ncbi:hypothetical protein BX070DRAFT_253550 [Coemansia spiralis]|nr:hypothetical protein BX070DRAFT_253550 [Coemansia spiralis]
MAKGRTFRQRRRRVACTTQQQKHGQVSKEQEWIDLRNWCKACKMPKTKLALAYFPNTFRGMMATRDICREEDVICVPEQLLVTASKAMSRLLKYSVNASVNISLADNISRKLSEHQTLTYWLYSESKLGKDSSWRYYIKSLPQSFASVPLFVLSGSRPNDMLSATTDNEKWVLAHITRSVRHKVADQQTRLFSDWTRTSSFVSTTGAICPIDDWRHYVWAWLAVSTRCIHLGQKATRSPFASQDTIALAPLLDLLNHSEDARISTHFDVSNQQFVIKTHKPYKKGEEVFISYGPHDNRFMLAEYGFVLARNPFQSLELDYYVESWVGTIKLRLGTAKKGSMVTMNPSDVDLLVDALRQRGLWGDFTLTPDDNDAPYRLQAALRLLITAEQQNQPSHQGVSAKRAVAQWERWLRGEPIEESSICDKDSAIKDWIGATCQEIVSKSAQTMDDIRKSRNGQKQNENNSTIDSYLVHCIFMVWMEINAVAKRLCSGSII